MIIAMSWLEEYMLCVVFERFFFTYVWWCICVASIVDCCWVLFIVMYWYVFFDPIFLENWFNGDNGRDFLISVNRTDFQIQWQQGSYKYWFGYKLKAPGLLCAMKLESLVCAETLFGWMGRTYPCGFYNNIQIFCMTLKHMLMSGKRVEADDGYIGKVPTQVLCQKVIWCIKDDKGLTETNTANT